MELKDMNQDERSLLLYLETCLVDHAGKVKSVHMNADDFDITERWEAEEFIEFGRLPSGEIYAAGKKSSHVATNWVRFSDDAWRLAHAERRARSERIISAREE